MKIKRGPADGMADGIFKDSFKGSQGVMERGETESTGRKRCPPVLLPPLYIRFFFFSIIGSACE